MDAFWDVLHTSPMTSLQALNACILEEILFPSIIDGEEIGASNESRDLSLQLLPFIPRPQNFRPLANIANGP